MKEGRIWLRNQTILHNHLKATLRWQIPPCLWSILLQMKSPKSVSIYDMLFSSAKRPKTNPVPNPHCFRSSSRPSTCAGWIKVLGFIQHKGPNTVGSCRSLLPTEDELQLLLKEHVRPSPSSPNLFLQPPILALTFALTFEPNALSCFSNKSHCLLTTKLL